MRDYRSRSKVCFSGLDQITARPAEKGGAIAYVKHLNGVLARQRPEPIETGHSDRLYRWGKIRSGCAGHSQLGRAEKNPPLLSYAIGASLHSAGDSV